MVRIRLPDTQEATLEAGRWHCSNTRLERLLNAMLSPWDGKLETQPELYEAKVVSKVLGAEIIE